MTWTKRWFANHGWWDRVALLWLVVTSVAVVFVFDDFGQTFDEDKHVTYGDLILAWFTSGFEDPRALSYSRDYLYGGAFDLAGSLFRSVVPLKPYEAMHLFGGIVGWFGLLGAWRLGRRLGGPAVGCVALVLVTAMPTYVGHAFNNPKDAPFAVGYVWALLGTVNVITRAPNLRRRDWISVGVLMGLSASVRVAGLLSFCFFGLAVVYCFLYGRRIGRYVDVRDFLRLVAGSASAVVIGWVVMIAAWPWALLQPLRRPVFALSYMSKFALAPRKIPFDGEHVYGFEVPWDYIPRLLALKLPEFLLLGLFAALLIAPALLRERPEPRKIAAWGLLGLSIVLPPAYAILKGSTLYGGIRHFLFVQPPMAIVAAAGIVGVSRRLLAWSRPAGLVTSAGACIGIVLALGTVVRLHPLQYVHYNRLAGGLQGADGRFELDYYGAGYKPAIEQFLDDLWVREPDTYLASTVRYAGCGGGAYLPPNFVKDKKNPQFHIGSTRSSCRDKHRSKPAFSTLERDGVPIVVVRDLREKSP